MATRFSVEAVFKAIDRVTAPMRKIQGRFSGFMDSVERSGRGMRTVGVVLGQAFQRGLAGANQFADRAIAGFQRVATAAGVAGAAVAAIAGSVISTGAEFEKTLMSAVARFPGEIQRGTEAFNALGAAAEEVGATTEFDAQQAAGALNVYAAAGFNAELAIASLAGAGDLATVSGLTLDEAARTAADSLGALGMRSSDAATQAANLARMNDVMARTTGLANTSVTELAEAVKVGGNMTIQSGQSFETFGALVASMAGANIKGAESGTAIRNMFSSLEAPSARAARALSDLHVSVDDGHGGMRDMVDIVGDLSEATKDMGVVARNAALNHIFGDAAMPAALALLNTGADGLRTFRTELENSGGAATRMAGVMRDTTAGEIDGFTSAIDGVKTAIFGLVQGPFRQLLGKLTEWTAANRGVIASGIGNFVQGIAKNFDTIVQRSKGLIFVASVIGGLTLAVKGLNVALAISRAIATTHPLIRLAMIIVGAIGLIIAYWPEISAWFVNLWEDVKWLGREIGRWFAAAWASVVSGASSMWSAVTGFFSRLWSGITSGVSSIVGTIAGFFSSVWSTITSTVSSVAGAVASAFQAVWSRVKGFFYGVLTFIVGAFVLFGRGVLGYLQPVIDAVMFVVGAIRAKWDEFIAWIKPVFGAVALVLASIWSSIKSTIDGVVLAIVMRILSVWNTLVGALTLVGETIKTVFTIAWNAVATKVMEIVTRIRTYWTFLVMAASAVGGSIRESFAAAWDSVVAKATEVYEVVKGIWAGITDFFQGLWDGIYNAFVSVFSRIGEFLSGIVGSIGAIVTAIQGVGEETINGEPATAGAGGGPQMAPRGGGAAGAGAGGAGGGGSSTTDINVRVDPGTSARVRQRGDGAHPNVGRSGNVSRR